MSEHLHEHLPTVSKASIILKCAMDTKIQKYYTYKTREPNGFNNLHSFYRKICYNKINYYFHHGLPLPFRPLCRIYFILSLHFTNL